MLEVDERERIISELEKLRNKSSEKQIKQIEDGIEFGHNYNVSDKWIKPCWNDVTNKVPCSITFSGKDANLIIQRIHKIATTIPFTKFQLPEFVFNGVPISPAYIALVLGSIGALGGAAETMMMMAGMAHAHGMEITFEYDIQNPFNLEDDKVTIKMRNK